MTDLFHELRITPKKPHGSLAWLLERWRDEQQRCTFGASDSGALLNLSKYRSRADLYYEKATAPQVVEPNNAMRWGNLVEPILLNEAQEILKTPLITPNVLYRRQRWSGSLDGVDNETNPSVVVEAKHTSRYYVRGVDDFPREWVTQGVIEGFLTGAKVFFIVHDSSDAINLFEFPEQPELLDTLLYQAETLGKLVDDGLPYDEGTDNFSAEQIALLFPSTEKAVELPQEATTYLELLEDAKALAKEAEKQEKASKDALARFLLDADTGTLNGVKVLTWKEQNGKTSFDSTRLKEEKPELYEEYKKESKPFRVMRTYRSRGESK